MVVVVANKSLDSKEQNRAVFLRLDVNILVFYRFTKSFYPDIVFSTAAAVHADLHFRVLRAGVSPFLARKLAALIGIDYFRYSMPNTSVKIYRTKKLNNGSRVTGSAI